MHYSNRQLLVIVFRTVVSVHQKLAMKLLIFVFSVKGIRLRVDKGLGRVWGVGSLELTVHVLFCFRPKPAFRRTLTLGHAWRGLQRYRIC